MNDKIQEKTVSCVYLSILSKFWVITHGLYSVDGANKDLYVRYFSSPAGLGSVDSTLASIRLSLI